MVTNENAMKMKNVDFHVYQHYPSGSAVILDGGVVRNKSQRSGTLH